jgi:predicted AAA+ superfamily ATPase
MEKRKPIIVRGARQVGKSTLVRHLAKAQGLNLIEVDFEYQPELAELFSSKDPKTIMQLLKLHYPNSHSEKSLLFLDEIQARPEVLSTLRYFYEKMPEQPVIAAGSLLDFALEEHTFSMPVGRIEYMFLGPLNFEDFLRAMGQTALSDFLNHYTLKDNYPDAIHKQLLSWLKRYLIVGGMPEAVMAYAENQDFSASERVKQSILNTYQDDFSKYPPPTALSALRKAFSQLPLLVGQKVKYSHIDPNAKSAAVAEALTKLSYAGLVYLVKHSACNGLPLGAQVKDKIFKPLMLDVGLLSTQLGLSMLNLLGDDALTLINTGAVTEQFIGQHLLYAGPWYEKPQLYYWVREKKSASAEIDYAATRNAAPLPIEVKAGKTGTLRSLHYFLQEKKLSLGVRFNAQMPSLSREQHKLTDGSTVDYQLLSLPLYMVSQLNRLGPAYNSNMAAVIR